MFKHANIFLLLLDTCLGCFVHLKHKTITNFTFMPTNPNDRLDALDIIGLVLYVAVLLGGAALCFLV